MVRITIVGSARARWVLKPVQEHSNTMGSSEAAQRCTLARRESFLCDDGDRRRRLRCLMQPCCKLPLVDTLLLHATPAGQSASSAARPVLRTILASLFNTLRNDTDNCATLSHTLRMALTIVRLFLAPFAWH
eukprot:6182136-Pleurochrysis_carterae.AAC.2